MQSVINFLRYILPRPIKQTAKRIMGIPDARIHPDWKILEPLGQNTQPHTVLDLGARNGWFFSCWKKWCPSVVVHAFEPEEAAYQRLVTQHASDPSIHLNPEGIGATCSTGTFYHLADSEVSSSFLQHDQQVWDQIKYQTGKVEERQVAMTTLDDYCAQKNIASVYLIKIDIQGFELNALEGGRQTLAKTDYVLVESAIRPLYKDAARFTQVHDFMVAQGFHLMNFRAWHRGNYVLMETDMLFRKNELAPKVDLTTEVDRYYIGHD